LFLFKHLVNEINEGYDEISTEFDPYVLVALIWSWLDQLKEPVLKTQEIYILFKYLPQTIFNDMENDDLDSFLASRSTFRASEIINWKELDQVKFPV
jgi:hypothetical protein